MIELQNKLVENKRQLTTVKTQIQMKERENWFVEFTKKELLALEKDTTTYKSVGKAYVLLLLFFFLSSKE